MRKNTTVTVSVIFIRVQATWRIPSSAGFEPRPTVDANAIRRPNNDERNKIFKSENDTHEFMAYFQKEMETKEGTISKLNDELVRKESEMRVEAKNVLEKAQRNLAHANDKMMTLEKELSDRIKILEGDLAALVRFRELRDFHDKAMKDMAAYNSLGATTKNIVEKNKQMAKDLRFHKKMTTELQAHAEALEERMANTWRENTIMQDRDKEYARQGQAKNNELKRLRAQIATLTKALADGVVKTRNEGHRTPHEVAGELEERALDGEGLRHLLVLKNRELKHLRRLSQYILKQRNEVETFFLEALEETKRRIIDGQQARRRRAVAEDNNVGTRDSNNHRTIFPKIRDMSALDSGPLSSSLPTDRHTNIKVDIASLTWEDKERVLRLLFAKINNVQGSVENTPDHPLEAAMSGAAAVNPPAWHQSPHGNEKVAGFAHTFVTQSDLSLRSQQLLLYNGEIENVANYPDRAG
ncbi:unnamed protein product [Ascophyllum nodosum]